MKYLFVILLCAFFASCNQEELDSHNETYFIDLIKNQIEVNDEIAHSTLIRVEKTGHKRVDIRVYQEMLALKTAREKLLEEVLANNFEYFNDTLIVEYQVFIQKVCEEEDSFAVMEVVKQELIPIQELNQLQKKPSKFQKIIWAYHCLYLENALLERYSMQVGSYCGFGTKANTFSDNNAQVAKPYEILISSIPARFEGTAYDGEHYTIVQSFEFRIDGIETQVKYKLERIGDVGVLRFTPSKKGKYSIRGYFHTQFENDKRLFISHKMYHSFEVK